MTLMFDEGWKMNRLILAAALGLVAFPASAAEAES